MVCIRLIEFFIEDRKGMFYIEILNEMSNLHAIYEKFEKIIAKTL
ncbi:hypothetical protein B4084_3869 [Bacillus cereus]|nr:hypothetical protein B4084_3869 [Bacillus cereus]